MSKTKEYMSFLAAFAAKPFKMGAIAPSSKGLAEMMLLKFKPGDFVAEIGAGTGAMTRVIRQRITDPREYLGFDINRDFISTLKTQFPELKFAQDSAENLPAHYPDGARLDYVVCSLPWNMWPSEHQAKILKEIVGPLKPGGHFATFSYWPMLYGPSGIAFRKLLKKKFKKVEATEIVWWNLPPAVVYVCLK